MTAWLTIVGIGEDGPDGLGAAARAGGRRARRCWWAGQRHLDMVPVQPGQKRIRLAEPVLRRAGAGAARHAGVRAGQRRPDVLGRRRDARPPAAGRGDARAAGALGRLARRRAARLAVAGCGGAERRRAAVGAGGRHLHPGARLLVLAGGGGEPARLAAMLDEAGFGASRLVVLEHLGGARERRLEGIAAGWPHADCAALLVVAVECRGGAGWSGLAGLPDAAYRHDGQLTKRDVRAVTLAQLARCRASCCGMSAPAAARSASNGCEPTPPAAPLPSRPTRRARR